MLPLVTHTVTVTILNFGFKKVILKHFCSERGICHVTNRHKSYVMLTYANIISSLSLTFLAPTGAQHVTMCVCPSGTPKACRGYQNVSFRQAGQSLGGRSQHACRGHPC